jgi:Tfp pilus assembly protein PilF
MNLKKGLLMNMPSVLKLVVAIFFLAESPIQVYALTPDQVFDKVKDSVFVVKTFDATAKLLGQGSGVLISSGKIATNCHVLEQGASYLVGQGERLVPASLFAQNRDKDICILEAKAIKGKPVQVGKAADLKVGIPVYAVGAPKGLELSISNGIIAQLRGGPPPLIQTTAAISPGSSGGGLFDKEGRLVGLTTLYIEGGQSLNFAIPVEWIVEVKPDRNPIAMRPSQVEWVKRARALNEMKDWKGQLDLCREWTEKDPKNVEAWLALGASYINLKIYEEAINTFRQVLIIDQNEPGVWIGFGVTYSGLGQYEKAFDSFRQALHIDNDHQEAWYYLGVAYSDLNRHADAIESYRQALRIDIDYALAWQSLGNSYFSLKRYEEAIDSYRQALRINSKDAYAWFNLGKIYAHIGNRTAALETFRELRTLDSDMADKLFNLIVPK